MRSRRLTPRCPALPPPPTQFTPTLVNFAAAGYPMNAGLARRAQAEAELELSAAQAAGAPARGAPPPLHHPAPPRSLGAPAGGSGWPPTRPQGSARMHAAAAAVSALALAAAAAALLARCPRGGAHARQPPAPPRARARRASVASAGSPARTSPLKPGSAVKVAIGQGAYARG